MLQVMNIACDWTIQGVVSFDYKSPPILNEQLLVQLTLKI